eukprot:6186112-Pleurochrysis_carterae.AAC.2
MGDAQIRRGDGGQSSPPSSWMRCLGHAPKRETMKTRLNVNAARTAAGPESERALLSPCVYASAPSARSTTEHKASPSETTPRRTCLALHRDAVALFSAFKPDPAHLARVLEVGLELLCQLRSLRLREQK